jgi:hypothetical protein
VAALEEKFRSEQAGRSRRGAEKACSFRAAATLEICFVAPATNTDWLRRPKRGLDAFFPARA